MVRFLQNSHFRLLLVAFLAGPCAVATAADAGDELPRLTAPSGDIYSGPYVGGAFQSLTFVNSRLGWNDYFSAGFLGASTVIANIEAGNVWFGHEAFNRPSNATTAYSTFTNTNSLNEVDFHATMVGHILAGTGYVSGTSPEQYSYVGLGMAPQATLVSAPLATSFSAADLGGFETSYDSVLTPFKAFFTGVGATKADVINSSWGGYDPAAISAEAVAFDGLAAQNRTVAFVAAAGNGSAEPEGNPGSGYNNITAGSLGGNTFLVPSDFSSRGLASFYNPATATMISNARVAVDVAAPGEFMVLAAYLGDSGGLGASTNPVIEGIIQQPSSTNRYFLNMDGTSFASPVVAGGIALLKDVAKVHPSLNFTNNTNALDTRVVKSVVMAGALETFGWNNLQTRSSNGVVSTTQGLDAGMGAGAFNLTRSTDAYFFGTRDVAGSAGGTITDGGWDFGALTIGATNSYIFDAALAGDRELTVSLNWFAGRTFNNQTDLGENLSFADFNLQVWEVAGGNFSSLVGQSLSTYNNAEFLRLDLTGGKSYGLRVTLGGMIYDLTGLVDSVSYGLAWLTESVGDLYWDPNGTNAATAVAVAGDWNGLTANWNTSSNGTGGSTTAVTTGLDNLIFSAGTNGTSSATITVDGSQMAHGLVLQEGTLTFSGTNSAAIQIDIGGIELQSTLQGDASFAGSVQIFLSGDQTWRNNSARNLNMTSPVSGIGNLVLESSSNGVIALAGSVDFAGSLLNRGSGFGTNTISGSIGTNVTSLTQQSSGLLLLSGNNTFTGATTVTSGTLRLAGAGQNQALRSTATISVASGATLLLGTSDQVNNSAPITLSGGTITRGSGVSEVFGNLNLTQASFLDFGTGTAGTLTFGTYAPGALLTVNNFAQVNTMVFGSDLSSTINSSSFFVFTNGGIASYAWNADTSKFTITAIPEASTYLAALCLLALCGAAFSLPQRTE
ncbi:MAG: S8 family serine peptidase [Chthoniobacterales bacterium]